MSAAVMLLTRAQAALAPSPDHRAVAVRHRQQALLYRRAGQLIRGAGRALKVENTMEAGRLLRLAKAALELAEMRAGSQRPSIPADLATCPHV